MGKGFYLFNWPPTIYRVAKVPGCQIFWTCHGDDDPFQLKPVSFISYLYIYWLRFFSGGLGCGCGRGRGGRFRDGDKWNSQGLPGANESNVQWILPRWQSPGFCASPPHLADMPGRRLHQNACLDSETSQTAQSHCRDYRESPHLSSSLLQNQNQLPRLLATYFWYGSDVIWRWYSFYLTGFCRSCCPIFLQNADILMQIQT